MLGHAQRRQVRPWRDDPAEAGRLVSRRWCGRTQVLEREVYGTTRGGAALHRAEAAGGESRSGNAGRRRGAGRRVAATERDGRRFLEDEERRIGRRVALMPRRSLADGAQGSGHERLRLQGEEEHDGQNLHSSHRMARIVNGNMPRR